MVEVDMYLEGDNTPLETFDDRHEYEYTGEGIVPTERNLTSLYTKDDSITQFTAHFHAVKEGTAFTGTHLTQVENTGLTADKLKAIAPKEPGVYSFVINGYKTKATRPTAMPPGGTASSRAPPRALPPLRKPAAVWSCLPLNCPAK